jgi:hypothetical protein
MKLFYVMGGGMGHLYRIHTFIHQFKLSGFKILTNNPLTWRFFSPKEIIHVQGESYQAIVPQVQQQLHTADFTELYIDAFPAGLFGEVKTLPGKKFIYLARRLKWSCYEQFVAEPAFRFDECIYFEELEEAHMQFIKRVSGKVSFAELGYPQPAPKRIPTEIIPADKPIWLIVHSFFYEEVEMLIGYAKAIAKMEMEDPAFVVLSDQEIDDQEVLHYSWFPASDWFPLAERIFTGGGFNTLHQLKPFRTRVTAIPFPRKFDDQVWRVEQFKSVDTQIDQ